VTVNEDVEQVQETLRQLNLIYSGLIVIGVYLVQPFLVAGSLDLSANICVIAFSVAIPLLAALVVINRQEAFRRRMTKSILVTIAQVVAQSCAFVGVVAGFWHIMWAAGVAMLAAGLVAVGVHSAGYARLEGYRWRPAEDGGERRDAGS
jgi:O-antigen/teichoic acid export membrane protein